MNKGLFTSEQVGAGHPDKLADQISDAVLDACLSKDKNSRVACETMLANRLVVVGGEITTKASVDIHNIVKTVLQKFNYDCNLFTIMNNINSQSPDINQGVDKADGEMGAGDQGIMFGFATNETKNLCPLAWTLSTEILKTLESDLRKTTWYKDNFDMKSQVTINYDGAKPVVDTVLVSCQVEFKHQPKLKKLVKSIITKVLAKDGLKLGNARFLFNPTGKFEIGGPVGDAGLTGRKIIADTYGGYGRHGGGAFSGKDSSKVDRSAAYAARYIAKNVVAAKWADTCEVQLSYAIGVAMPTSIQIKLDEEFASAEQVALIEKLFPLTPGAITKHFGLTKPIFSQTSTYGHFGKSDLPWEKTDLAKKLK